MVTDGETEEIEDGVTGPKLVDVLQRFHEYCNPRSGVIVGRFEFHGCSQLHRVVKL
jgi:hypothetical protein